MPPWGGGGAGGAVRKRDGVVGRMHFVLFIEHGTAPKDADQSATGSAEVLQASAKFGLNLHSAFLSR